MNQLYSTTQIGSDYASTQNYEYAYRTPFGYFDELKYENGMPTAQSHYFYDQSGQVTQKNVYTGNIESSLIMNYDDTGNLERVGTGVFASNYFYSNYGYTAGRLTKVQTNGLATVSASDADNSSYEYYADGKLKKITYPRLNDNTLLTTEYFYNAIGRLTSVINKKNTTVLSSFAYTYDANGNITTVNDGSSIKTYIYDKLNRLIEIHPAVGNQTIYTYDLRGNRLTLSSDRFDFDLVDTGYTYLPDDTETVTGSALKVTQEEEISLSKTEPEVTQEASPSPDNTSDNETRTVTGSAIIAASGIQTTNMEYYADGLRASKYTD
ncbi:MAG: repeat protein, partial [Anaerocolumna sp.]|nr:repeat protein [Anaerocolumna sp.]